MKHDRQLVEAFIRGYNVLMGFDYSVQSWPEDETRNKPAVEALAKRSDGRTIAIEHTLLQAFVGDKTDAQPLLAVFAPLEDDPSLTIREHDITISLDPGVVPKGVDWKVARERVRDWLRAKKDLFPEGNSTELIQGLSFDLWVQIEKTYISADAVGTLTFVRSLPLNALPAVVTEALSKKLPKLVRTSADERVLLLEKDHPAHGYASIATTLDSSEIEFPDLRTISAVWVVNTVSFERSSSLRFIQVWPGGCTNRFYVSK